METKKDYYMHLDLPIYGKVGLIEAKGIHFFNAISKSQVKKDNNLLKFIILEILYIDDKKVTEEFLNEMSLKDVNYLTQVVGTMMDDNYKI